MVTVKEVDQGHFSTEILEDKTEPVVSDEVLLGEDRKTRTYILSQKSQYLALNNEPKDALIMMKRVIRLDNSPNNNLLAWHIAFQAWEYQQSVDFYAPYLARLDLNQLREYTQALRYLDKESFLTELVNTKLPDAEKKAYEISWKCENMETTCEKDIIEYGYNYEPMNNLKQAIQTAEKTQNTDPDYKEALLLWAWYQNKDFTTVVKRGTILLSKKPDYRPVQKIVGFSAFKLGDIERAEVVLKRYKELEPKDPENDFVLGLIQFEKRDFETANLYFNNAILGWYVPKIIVERKLAYTFNQLGMTDNMFQVLDYIVNEENVTENDLTNAIYLALRAKKYDLAQNWIRRALSLYPDKHDILALRAWYLRETGNSNTALIILDNILKNNPNHLVSLVQKWSIAVEEGDSELARDLLQRAQVIDTTGTWSDDIRLSLSRIKE